MQKPSYLLPLDIPPTTYNTKNTKQLGNHHLHSKTSSSQKWNDPRLSVLNPDYFKQKNVLDIGCNQGILTIPIAIRCMPESICGVDVGGGLVRKAEGNVGEFVRRNQHYRYPKHIIDDVQKLPLYLRQKLSKKHGEITSEIPPNIQLRPKSLSPSSCFPQNIKFSLQNILAQPHPTKYDCILCMNVTKWIHLAFGDEGIRRLFDNIDKMADDGTILILQSQPWSSYRKKKNLYQSYSWNYRMILLKPERFKDYLYKLGFRVIEEINPNTENCLKHQILVLQKKCNSKYHQ